MKTVAFFGHRKIFDTDLIKNQISEKIMGLTEQGFSHFLVGSHGDFDRLCLSACLEYKKRINNNIKISVVLTNLPFLNNKSIINDKIKFYENNDCETLFYDIEHVYFKNRIIFSNKKMIDDCDLVVCYVDMKVSKSGSRTAINYAIKQKKKIINLFKN